MQEEKIITKSGVELEVEKRFDEHVVEVSLRMEKGGDCLLHWGVRRHPRAPWQMPPESVWPKGSRPFEGGAVQTPFVRENGAGRVLLRVERPADFSIIDFVLFFPDQSRWDNNDGQNYHILLPKREKNAPSPLEILEKETDPEKVAYKRPYTLETGDQLALAVVNEEKTCRVAAVADTAERPVLHWGISRHYRYEWFLPPDAMRPSGTSVFQGKAAETPFYRQGEYWRLVLEMKEGETPLGISFVLKLGDSDQWLKDAGKNFYVPLAPPPDYGVDLGDLGALAQEIIEKEMSPNSWTLMHRFNLCYDLLDRIEGGNADGLALIFVWLRFSTLRQLDWQRNYNTKPRELGHAQDRLTLKLADRYRREERDREWIRLIMTTLGRGSDAQRVRDEVLNIMHRHHIKEVSGHFMEEWHQKLHNNTTPDDVVLCEAYLAFLRSDGNLDVFYNTLNEGGVTKERLENYERPIKSAPDFIPHLKDALIHDFENFLRILKEVHSGADLETAVNAGRRLFDQEMHDRMDFLLAHREGQQGQVEEIAEKIAEARRRIAERLESDGEGTRDLLFLDLALEDFLRILVERNLHRELGEDDLLRWVSPVLGNLILSNREDELEICLRHWERLERDHRGREWSMQAQAVVDRLQRIVGGFIDRYYRMLQPKAEFLGRAFRAEAWTVRLFSEEVVRGRAAFSLSALIRRLVPLLREGAGLGDWQVISRSPAQGEIRSAPTLRSIQEARFNRPTVIVADEVGGNEEIPEGVTAVITPDTVDIVSHLAIRARNAGLLFAVCYDGDEIERLKSREGRTVRLYVNPGGDVVVEETAAARGARPEKRRRMSAPVSRPHFNAYALRRADFNEESLGGKSNNLNRLRGRLPEWINLPPSAAVPFRVLERVLSMPENRMIAEKYEALTLEIDREEGKDRSARLEKIREVVLGLKAPDELVDSLRGAMEAEGLAWPERWEDAWMCVKRVWASKWNDRAYLSRLANGIRHEDLFMAVLIQQVVEAEYSFVIHTVHPFTGNRGEVYAEAVIGLGETLVGNYPGKALSFRSIKGKRETNLLSFPSKSVGLFGGGLIFRSDSNGEDLAEYAGAGLYDSFMLQPAESRLLDYSHERLIRDREFRDRLLLSIAQIGETVEEVMGRPQDIEGAYSKDRFYVLQTRPQVGLQDA